MKQIDYSVARKLMLPGDIMGFGGNGFISKAIKTVQNYPVSHVGIILQSRIPNAGKFINMIIESTSIGDGFAGVQINRMSTRIKQYDGRVWWLPLSHKVRAHFDIDVFFEFMLSHEGKEYDIPQAIGSAIDFIPANREDLDKLFCSELAAAGLEKGAEKFFSSELVLAGLEGLYALKGINASEQTPKDVCKFDIYDEPYQLKGKLKEL